MSATATGDAEWLRSRVWWREQEVVYRDSRWAVLLNLPVYPRWIVFDCKLRLVYHADVFYFGNWNWYLMWRLKRLLRRAKAARHEDIEVAAMCAAELA